ncbi:MAG: glycosyl hydrolase [Armatimonadota bacterium]
MIQIPNKPDPDYTACPLWFWNGDLDPGELVRQIGLMHEKGIRAFVIHPRKGLLVKYLSDEWFERVGVAIEEAAKLEMHVWLWDEEDWPSGYAGGRVLARDNSYVAQNLTLERHYIDGPNEVRLELDCPHEVRASLAVRISDVIPVPRNPLESVPQSDEVAPWSDRTKFNHVYAKDAPIELERDGEFTVWSVPTGRWCVMVVRQKRTDHRAEYSGHDYTDVMNQGAVEAFIEETHEQYYRRFGENFGKTIRGFFIDEPGLYNNFREQNVGSVSWTHDFALEFEKRRGYSIMPLLPHLWEVMGERTWQIRFDYWQTLTELIYERFFRTIADWCGAHKVQLTGHLLIEELLVTISRMAGNPFAALKSFHVPGVDKIDEETEKISEKLVSSIAHANGCNRVISETFACIGWKLAPSYMKNIIDYQYVRGVNWLRPHAFYYSIDDYRKYECPPSEFFQNPWWEHSKPLWDYVHNLSYALSQGTHAASVALYYPIDDTWARMTPEDPGPFPCFKTQSEHGRLVMETDAATIRLNTILMESQYDFDVLDYSVLSQSELAEGFIRVCEEEFRAVIVPPVSVIDAAALDKILGLAESGGTAVFVERLPYQTVRGEPRANWSGLCAQMDAMNLPGLVSYGCGKVGFVFEGVGPVVELLTQTLTSDCELQLADGERVIIANEGRPGNYLRDPLAAIKYHRRICGDSSIYFLVNESSRSLTVNVKLAGGPAVEEWCPVTGVGRSISSSALGDDRTELRLSFLPWQSHVLILKPGEPGIASTERVLSVQDVTGWKTQVTDMQWDGELTSWNRLGLPLYSGTGVYNAELQMEELPSTTRIILDLGDVLETASVEVNGKVFGPMAWKPFTVDITESVTTGLNHIKVTVCNTNTNAFERQERISGLLGPVRITTVQ